jgi:DNA processing protein
MTVLPTAHQIACATLTYVAEPADRLLGSLLQALDPVQVLACIQTGTLSPAAAGSLQDVPPGRLAQALGHWRARLAAAPPGAGISAHAAAGTGLVCPGDPGWPAQIDDLGLGRPYALWVRGTADLRGLCDQSVAVIGARAATAYGQHVCSEMASVLAATGWTVISGGAFGIDASAHRAALAAGGRTVAVMPCGPDVAYPPEHAGLLQAIAASGAVVSEWPPGTRPARHHFLARNRVTAALARATVVVEAGVRSGTLATAHRAIELGRPLMAVPGPVTSPASVGCHELIRDRRAALVSDPADALAHLNAAPAAAMAHPAPAAPQIRDGS